MVKKFAKNNFGQQIFCPKKFSEEIDGQKKILVKNYLAKEIMVYELEGKVIKPLGIEDYKQLNKEQMRGLEELEYRAKVSERRRLSWRWC